MKIVKVITAVILILIVATGLLAQSRFGAKDALSRVSYEKLLDDPAFVDKITGIDVSSMKSASDPSLRPVSQVEATVVFNDANLEAEVREALGIPEAPITDSDMLTLTTLVSNDKNISDLTGLEYALNLNVLSVRANNITDLTPIQSLYALAYLYVDNNYVLTSIAPIANLTNLLYLGFSNNAVTDISALTNIRFLVSLSFNNNQITNISALQNQRQLDYLFGGNNGFSDISPIQNCTSISTLYLHGNQISDMSPLNNFTNLGDLYITNNQISNMSAVANMTVLQSLAIHTNQISDVSPVDGLTSLATLVINDNNISNLSPLASLSSLSTLYLGNNNISDVSSISGLTALSELKLDGNYLDNDDLPSFYDLDNLAGLDLTNNPDITSGTAMQTLGDNLDNLTCEDILWDGECGVDPPVPVELSAFNAQLQDGKVVLQWRTETESNSFGFEIEKSRDNENFMRVGFVEGSGTTTNPVNYEFIDKNVASGANYYRLRQVDFDGQFEYSDVIEVAVTAPDKFRLSQNFPNPFNSSTMISFTIPERANVEITVYDITGKTVFVLTNKSFEAGSYNIPFNAGSLPSGSYYYKMTAGQYTSVQKLVVLK